MFRQKFEGGPVLLKVNSFLPDLIGFGAVEEIKPCLCAKITLMRSMDLMRHLSSWKNMNLLEDLWRLKNYMFSKIHHCFHQKIQH